MKKAKAKIADDEMRPEYDFTRAVRGKYYESFKQGSGIVLLEPDVSAAFPTSAAVNQALREIVARPKGARVVRRPSSPQRRPTKPSARRS